jgi:hypothetical protein
MTIPLSQLRTWSNRSQTDTAINARTRIRKQLHKDDTPLSRIDFHDFLQGSYANYTNIVGDHDVDIVVRLNITFNYDVDHLPEPAKTACLQSITPATFTLEDFRPLVLDRLRYALGSANVVEGNKAVKIPGKAGEYMDADVVICQKYRLYYPSYGGSWSYHEGIALRDRRDDRLIANFPDQHLENGQKKNQATDEAFKPIVRIYKNIRNYLVDHGRLERNIAPSYFIQGLLYNVHNDQFTGDLTMDMLNTLVWFTENTDKFQSFVCQNGIQLLFGETDEQWKPQNATKFLHEIMQLWRDWS